MNVRPGRSRPARIATGAVAVLVAAVLVTWGLGGFGAAPATGVRRFAVGVPIQLTRWTLVVQKVQLADTDQYGDKQQTTLRVFLQATWKQSASTLGEDDADGDPGVVVVVVPGGPPVDLDGESLDVDGYSGGFDPGVTRPEILAFTWPKERVAYKASTQPPIPRLPTSVDVVIRDEYLSPNLLFDDDWRRTQPVGYVRVPVQDVRK